MSHSPWRRPAALAGAALIASALPLLSAIGPASAADTAVKKTLSYSCVATVQPVGQGEAIEAAPQTVPVDVAFTVPTLTAGATVPAFPVSVGVTLDEDLHEAALDNGAAFVSGGTTDAQLDVTAGETTVKSALTGLAVEDQPIEQDPAKPWTITLNGTTSPFTVPDATSVDVLGPTAFTATATVKDAEKVAFADITLKCDAAEGGRLLAPVAVEPKADTRATPAISLALRTTPVIQNVTKAKLSIRTNSEPQATGKASVLAEDGRVIAEGTLNETGDVLVELPVFGRSGIRALTVKTEGDENNIPVTAAINLLVTGQVTPEIAAGVRTNPVLAGKTAATLSVRTNSRPQATGAVAVKTEDGRIIATGTLGKGGDTLVKLPVFGKRGTRTLTILYAGDTYNRAVATVTVFRVR